MKNFSVWTQIYELLEENLENKSEIFPLRSKTEEYVKAAYHWALNNRKIIHVINTEPIYVLARKHADNQYALLRKDDQDQSVLVFVSEEDAISYRKEFYNKADNIDVVKTMFYALFKCLAEQIHEENAKTVPFRMDQDVHSIVLIHGDTKRKMMILKEKDVCFFSRQAEHTSPFPAGTTTVVQTMHSTLEILGVV